MPTQVDANPDGGLCAVGTLNVAVSLVIECEDGFTAYPDQFELRKTFPAAGIFSCGTAGMTIPLALEAAAPEPLSKSGTTPAATTTLQRSLRMESPL
jgi:hypothetical protein